MSFNENYSSGQPPLLLLSLKFKMAICFVPMLLLLCTNAVADDIDRANEALAYIEKNLTGDSYIEPLDITALEQHLGALSLVLENYQLDGDDERLVRYNRIQAIEWLNFHRFHTDRIVDIGQVEMAIKDTNILVQQIPSVEASSLQYGAGLMALHLLESADMAYEFWLECAGLQHAGCMNILASGHFTGENGIPVDFQQSVLWHQGVYNTGTDFKCAGFYSANQLAQLSFHFPKYDTGGTWQEWSEKSDALMEELKERAGEQVHCLRWNQDTIIAVMNFATEGELDSRRLDDALSMIKDKALYSATLMLKNGADLSQAPDLLDAIEYDSERCYIALQLTLFAKYSGLSQQKAMLEDYLRSTGQCTWGSALIDKLQTDGRW